MRYRDPDHRSREKAGFARKIDAEEYLAGITVASSRGEYIDPGAARVTIGELATEWLSNQTHLKPSSFRPIEIAWRVHVAPAWDRRRVGDVRHSEVQTWVTRLYDNGRASATTVLRAHGVLAGILDVAVRDRRIRVNPSRGVNLPKKRRKPRAYLSHRQVDLLARHAGNQASLVLLLAYTGLRWGEATGLRVRHVDLERRRLLVEENAVNVGDLIVVGTPKNDQPRSVPYPSFLDDAVVQWSRGKARDSILIGNGMTHIRPPDGRRGWFVGALKRARALDPTFPTMTLHDLRHTAASLAISAGANVKAVQRMLGHASAAMTLDVYGDLFEDDLDAVTVNLESARRSQLGSNGSPTEDAISPQSAGLSDA